MIGSKQFEITHDDFIKGMNTSNDLDDGGFSNKSTNININGQPGWITARGNTGVISSNLGDTTLGAAAGSQMLGRAHFSDGVTNKLGCFDSNGNYYTIDLSSDAISLVLTDFVNNYAGYEGIYDMISYTNESYFNSVFYITTPTQILLWDGASGLDFIWWTSTKHQTALVSNVPHKMCIWNKLLYITNGNILISYDGLYGGSGTVVADVLTLPKEQIITEISVDPGTGKLILAVANNSYVTNRFDGASTKNAYVGIYDGWNPTQFMKKIPVDMPITSFYNLSGTIYIIYGQNLGNWNGSGITFLRKLHTNQTAIGVVNRQKIINIGSTLYLAEGNNILAYGETIGKQDKVFYYPYAGNHQINMLMSPLGNQINICYKNDAVRGEIDYFDTTAAGDTTTGTFYSLVYHMPRFVNFYGVDIFLKSPVIEGYGSHAWSLLDSNNNTISLGSITVSPGTVWTRMVKNAKTSTIQLQDTITNTASAIDRIIVYYDLAE